MGGYLFPVGGSSHLRLPVVNWRRYVPRMENSHVEDVAGVSSGETGLLTPTAVVAARVRELRRQRGWTGQQLADAMTALGIPWNRGLVSKLEIGDRETISVAELIALACAFRVSPIALVVPSEPTDYALTPNCVSSQILRVYDWIVGRDGLPTGEQNPSRGWFGIPAGLPEIYAEREKHFAAERDHGLSELRVRNAELEAAAKSRPQGDPKALLAILERTELDRQAEESRRTEAEKRADDAERRAEAAESARQHQAALVREFLLALPDEQRKQLGGLLTGLHMESQRQSSDGE